MRIRWGIALRIALFAVLVGAGIGSLSRFDTALLVAALLVAAFLAGIGLILCYCPRPIRQAFGIIVLMLLWALIAFGPLLDPWTRMNFALQAKALSEDVQTLPYFVSGRLFQEPETGLSQNFLETVENRLKRSSSIEEDTIVLGWVGLLGESPRALDEARKLIARYPRLSAGRWLLVHHLYNSGEKDLEEAFSQMDTLTTLDSMNAAPLVIRAVMEWEAERREQGIQALMAAGQRPFYLPYSDAITRAKWKVLECTGLLDLKTKATALLERPEEVPWIALRTEADTMVQRAADLARSGKQEESRQTLLTLASLGEKMYNNPLGYSSPLGWTIKQKAMKALRTNGFFSEADARKEEEKIALENAGWEASFALQISRATLGEISILRIAFVLWILSLTAVFAFGLFSLILRKLFFRALLWSGLTACLAMGCFAIQVHPFYERQRLFLDIKNPNSTAYALIPYEAFGLWNEYCTGGV